MIGEWGNLSTDTIKEKQDLENISIQLKYLLFPSQDSKKLIFDSSIFKNKIETENLIIKFIKENFKQFKSCHVKIN